MGTHTLQAVQCTHLLPNKRGAEVACRKSFSLLTLMYIVAAYLVPDIGDKDPLLSGGR